MFFASTWNKSSASIGIEHRWTKQMKVAIKKNCSKKKIWNEIIIMR